MVLLVCLLSTSWEEAQVRPTTQNSRASFITTTNTKACKPYKLSVRRNMWKVCNHEYHYWVTLHVCNDGSQITTSIDSVGRRNALACEVMTQSPPISGDLAHYNRVPIFAIVLLDVGRLEGSSTCVCFARCSNF